MTQEEIKAGVLKHLVELKTLQATYEGNVGIARAQIAYYQGFCDHPKRYETSCMGDRGWHCPDCNASL